MAKGQTIHEAVFKISGQTDKSLGAAFKAAESAAASVGKNIGSKLASAGAAMGKAAAVGAAAVATATVAAGKALIDLGSEFDKASDAIRIGTGATGEALEALNKDFEAVYSTVPTTMEDASQAIADYNTRLGLTGEPLQELSAQAIQVSNLLGEDLSAVIEESSQAFQQWDIEGEKMGDAMDYVFKASQSTGVGFADLMASSQQYGAQMQELGFDFEETVAMLGQLDKAGVNSSEVMSALKKSVGNMAKEGLDASEGMSIYYQKIMDAKDMTEATAIATEVFGSKAGSTLAAAIREGSFAVGDLTEELKASDETIMKAAEDTMDFPEKLQLLKQKAQVALKPVANSMFDQINKAMPYIEEIINKTMPFIAQLGEQIGAMMEKAMPMIMNLFDLVSGWIGDNLPMIMDAVMGVGDAVLPVIEQIGGVIGELLPWIIDGIMQLGAVVFPIIQQIGGVIAQTIFPLFESLKPLLDGLFDAVLAALPAIGDVLNLIIPVIAEIGKVVLPMIITAITGVITHIKLVLEFITNVFTGDWEAAWQNIKDIVANIFETFADVLATPINAAIGLINKAIKAINNALGDITIPDWVPIFGGKTFSLNIPEIPMLAKGGTITSPTLAMVGEAGTETVVPHNNTPRSRALLAEAAQGVYGSGGGNTFNISFAPTIYGGNAEETSALTMEKFTAWYDQMKRDNFREVFA
ncbi:MAG: phage tail tape measure protein [Spirochaetales bacterium]|nr:phage tail tape measure protein [Spirochaetales bacterium]